MKIIFSKCLSDFFISMMLYMHICSALCASGSYSCCGKETTGHCKKSCCSPKNDSQGKEHNCQDFHFAFFNTTGQSSPEKGNDVLPVFQSLTGIIVPVFIIQPIGESKNISDYIGFHPPPPKADIRIFIQSFII